MRTLAVFDRKDYDPALPRHIRPAARAVVVIDRKVLMIYSAKYDFYCFPGGGAEAHETLVREVKEETGLTVNPESVQELGLIVEIRKDKKKEGIYEQREHYFTCAVDEEELERSLALPEIEPGDKLTLVAADEAITVNLRGIHIHPKYTETEGFVLNMIKDNSC